MNKEIFKLVQFKSFSVNNVRILLLLFAIYVIPRIVKAQCPNSVCSEIGGTNYNVDAWSLERDATVRVKVKVVGTTYDAGSGVIINNYNNDGEVYILSSFHTYDLDGDRQLSKAEVANVENNTIIEYNRYCNGGGSNPFTKVGGLEIVAGSGHAYDDYILLKSNNLTSTEKSSIFYASVSSRISDLIRPDGLTLHHADAGEQQVTVFNTAPVNDKNNKWKFPSSSIVHGGSISEGASGGGNFKHYNHFVWGFNKSATESCSENNVHAVYDFKNKSTQGYNSINNVILNGQDYVPSYLPHNFTYKAGTSITSLYMQLADNVRLTIKSSDITGVVRYRDGGSVVFKPVIGEPVVIQPMSNNQPTIIGNDNASMKIKYKYSNNLEKNNHLNSSDIESNTINIYPNPSHRTFTIDIDIDNDEAFCDIAIYDLRGRLVTNLVANSSLQRGSHLFQWNPREDNQSQGVFIAKVRIDNKVHNKKIVLLNAH